LEWELVLPFPFDNFSVVLRQGVNSELVEPAPPEGPVLVDEVLRSQNVEERVLSKVDRKSQQRSYVELSIRVHEGSSLFLQYPSNLLGGSLVDVLADRVTHPPVVADHLAVVITERDTQSDRLVRFVEHLKSVSLRVEGDDFLRVAVKV